MSMVFKFKFGEFIIIIIIILKSYTEHNKHIKEKSKKNTEKKY